MPVHLVHRPSSHSHGPDSYRGPGVVEGTHGNLEPLTDTTKHIGLWNDDVIKEDWSGI